MTMPPAPNMERKFTRHFKTAKIMWGSSECREHLINLGVQNNDDPLNIPVEVLVEINHIIEIHDKEFPMYVPTREPYLK